MGRPECSERMREIGSAASIYPIVCRSAGMRLALSELAEVCADFDVRSVAAANLVGCVSWSIGTYMLQRVLNYADLCKELR